MIKQDDLTKHSTIYSRDGVGEWKIIGTFGSPTVEMIEIHTGEIAIFGLQGLINNSFKPIKELTEDELYALKLPKRVTTKPAAIAMFKEITGGAGLERDSFPKEWKGRLAHKNWDDPMFTLGLEYGALIMLMKIFNVTPEDLK